MARAEPRLNFSPYDCTPGDGWEVFDQNLQNHCSGEVDDRGWSLADYLLSVCEGSANGPPLPLNNAAHAADRRKAQASLRRRAKESYSIIQKHISDCDWQLELKNNHFQNGRAAYLALAAACATPVDALKLRQLNAEWHEVDLLADIGVNANTVSSLLKRLKALNSKRPIASRKTSDEIAERILECIMDTSKHFSESATKEYRATVGSRDFELAGGQRDLAGLVAYYHGQWKSAVENRLPGFTIRDPIKRPSRPSRNTLESGLIATESLHSAGEYDYYSPRPGSPSETLHLLADAGHEVAGKRGSVTTSDWSILTQDELCLACDDGGQNDNFDVALVFDSDDTASVDIICNRCRGAGHIERMCPSSKKFRSFSYVIALLQAKQKQVGNGPPRRPPGRGQRAPFYAQPRRFEMGMRGGGRTSESRGRQARGRARDGGRRAYSATPIGDDYATSFSDESESASAAVVSPPPSVAPLSSSSDERLESAQSAVPIVMPTTFSVSDDSLFESERLHYCAESTPSVTKTPCSPPIDPSAVRSRRWLTHSVAGTRGMMLALATLVVSMIISTLNAGERLLAGAGTACIFLICLLGLARCDVEHAFIGKLLEHRGVGLRGTIDSGATTTSIPPNRIDLITRITDEAPNLQLQIADDKWLEILKIGEMDRPVRGYKLVEDPAVDPRDWREIPTTDVIPSTRTFVVEGLGNNTILYSTRGLKRDGVNVYFNDDNSIRRQDCLRLASGTVVPFLTGKAYRIDISGELPPPSTPETCNATSTPAALRRSARAPALFHRAVGHCGKLRMRNSNIVIDGVKLSDLDWTDDNCSCRGCRIGNRSAVIKTKKPPAHHSTAAFSHFGQEVNTDLCTGFEPSFPHAFRSMCNFVDRYGKESWLMFMRNETSTETASALTTFHMSVQHRLRDGMIGRWVTDNGYGFLGSDVQSVADALVQNRGYSVPNESNTLAVPERHWGVLQRMMRSDMHYPPQPVPPCMWPWSARQNNLLLYFLPTNSFKPPQSPFQFATGDSAPVDLSWARTMFCDVTVSVPLRDINGKLGARSADGCHLGYDERRNAHFVYVPSLRRLSTFIVTEWREDSFEHVMRLSSDTPVEYVDTMDFPVGGFTQRFLPRRFTARGPVRVVAAAEGTRHVLFLYHRNRDHSAPALLRQLGYTVTCYDIADGHDLSDPTLQRTVLDAVAARAYSFVFMCPPCTTASIAFVPPLRLKSAIHGVSSLSTYHRQLVDDADAHFTLCFDVIDACTVADVPWCFESCASRSVRGPAYWPKFAHNGFVWDMRRMRLSRGVYMAFAQCRFDAPWQKYTGLMASAGRAAEVFNRMFSHAVCTCTSHTVKLQGYDVDGIARTSKAHEYNVRLSQQFCAAIDESCKSAQEGECADWSEELHLCSTCDLQTLLASPAPSSPPALPPVTEDSGIFRGLSREEIISLNASAYRESRRPDDSVEMEIWASDAEGAFRVSEIGGIPVPKNVADAMRSTHWPLFRSAMEEEIKGKLDNGAWLVVPTPKSDQVHRSRWVFAVAYHEDGSIRKIKARFVGCGYSMTADKDYDKVFAATLPGVSFRVLLVCIADEDLETDHIDAVKAFTQADIDRKVYVHMPEGFSTPGYVLLLQKALEGIKQGAFLWFKHNRAAWIKLGFVTWMNETNLYYHPTLKIRIGVFADDTLVGYPKSVEAQYRSIKAEYATMINIGALTISPVVKFINVGIERDRRNRTLTISQKQYISQMAEEYKELISEHDTPFGTTREQRTSFEKIQEASGSPVDKAVYLGMMGKLVWPSSMTRPDISEAVSTLCSMVSQPLDVHLQAAYVILGYLGKTKHLGITYGGRLRVPPGLTEFPPGFEESHGLYVIHDSSWGLKIRPMGGHAVMMANGSIDWMAKQLKLALVSTCEAETAVASRAVKAGAFARELAIRNGIRIVGPTPTIGDNAAMHALIQHDGATQRTRYYERATMLIKRAVLLLLFYPYLIGTSDMAADIFTKALDKGLFVKFRNIIMNCHPSLRDSLMAARSTVHGEARLLIERLVAKI